jgi:SAM-dependent methyltransferase
MKEVFPTNIVRDAYEDPTVVARYQDRKLWMSEEILIQSYFPKDGNVLDIGCGRGRTSVCLTQMGYKVIGMDLSSRMVESADEEARRVGLNIDFRAMDARNLDFPENSFDAALFSANGMDHVPGYAEKLKVFRQVFRVLKPGGIFIFSVHRIWSPDHLRKLLSGGIKLSIGKILGLNTLEKEWGELYDLNAAVPEERYGQFLTSGKWKDALKTAGFELVMCRSRYRLESRRTLGWLRRSLNSANFLFYVVQKPKS